MNSIKINELDNVAVALTDIKKGSIIDGACCNLTVSEDIKRGHKISLCRITKGSPVIKYGNRIGVATCDINPGSHVHVHNIKTALSGCEEYDYEYIENPLRECEKKSFMGYRRNDGRVAVRNELWIIPTVGCVNSVARKLAGSCQDLVTGSIDGLWCFTHPYGCSQMGDDHAVTRKILASLVDHPNAGGVLVLSLGCENLTIDQFKEELGEWDDNRVKFMICQNTADELEEGRRLLEELAEYAGKYSRTLTDASELVIGLKCGGSDGLSGITANPAVGGFSDRLISIGGSTILTEVPEMFGAESLLFDRCCDRETFQKAVEMSLLLRISEKNVWNVKRYWMRDLKK